MGLEPETKLVVKNSFLEYVGENKVQATKSLPGMTRQRSLTEPSMSYGEVLAQACDASSSSSHTGDSPDDVASPMEPTLTGMSVGTPLFLGLATPEVTPLHFPMARQMQMPDWQMPEAYNPQAMDGYWGAPMYNWWAPDQFATGQVFPDGSCEQYQAGVSMLNQVYMPMNINSDMSAGAIPQEAPLAKTASTNTNKGSTKETRTTVMIRNLPESYSRSLLLKLLDAQGFFGRFDFVYLPVDFKHQKNLGYALINLVSSREALRLTSHFEGFSDWGMPSDSSCSVGWCSPQQGLEAHVERYRNSPVMHESVPEEWRPMLLSHGVPIAFPPPTLKIKAPKVKGRQV